MNTPNDASDSQIAKLYDEIPAVEPLTVQVRHLDLSAWPRAQAESEKPRFVKALLQNLSTPELDRRLSCAGLEAYIDCNGNLCIVTVESATQHRELVRNERQARVDDVRRHHLAVEKEVTERKLTELDSEWRSRFSDWTIAREYYHEELSRLDRRPSRVIYHQTATEPTEYADRRDESDDDNDSFDTDLEPSHE